MQQRPVLLEWDELSPHRPHILLARRAAAVWLVVVSMLVGPMGMNMSVALAKTCGVSCPCDDAHASDDGDHVSHRDAHHDAGESDHHDEGPVDDDGAEDCPDDCPDCDCCSGVVLAVVPLSTPSVQAPYCSFEAPRPPEAQPVGAIFDVYRPPRSLI